MQELADTMDRLSRQLFLYLGRTFVLCLRQSLPPAINPDFSFTLLAVMDKATQYEPSPQFLFPSDVRPPRPWRPTLSRNNTFVFSSSILQDLPVDDMPRPTVISLPQTNDSFCSSMDVEALGAPPRKMSVDSARSGLSGSIRELHLNKPLPPRPNSSLSHGGAPTPDLYRSGESEESVKSESPPLKTPPVVLSPRFGSTSEGESKRSSISSLELDDVDPQVAEYEQFRLDGLTFLHPFDYDKVPYRQAYSDVSLQNDYCTHELLSHLTPEGSPTFLVTRRPQNILDLGCGRGLWVAETAVTWKHARITAFDVVDLSRLVREWLPPSVASRITWMKGNFLSKPLPFGDKTFDLVRMSCLSPAIPVDCWVSLFTEIKRVLAPGGRLELIDDELFFPEIQGSPPDPPRDPPRRATSLRKPSTNSTFEDEDEEEFIEGRSSESPKSSRPTMSRSPTSPNFKALKLARPSLTHSSNSYSGGRRYTQPSAPSDEPGSKNWEIHDPPPLTFEERATNARDMEQIFTRMLIKSMIHPRPHEILEEILIQVFGEGRAGCMQHFYIALPTTDAIFPSPLPSPPGPVSQSKGSSRIGSRPQTPHAKSRSVDERPSPRPTGSIPKAMRVLGEAVPMVELHQAEPSEDSSGKPLPRYQPPGFVVLPNNVFVPCEPGMLEMHACKNMHLVMSSKHAISGYIKEQYEWDHGPTVTEDEFDHFMRIYDEFKRTRLGWSNRAFHPDEEDSASPPTFATKQGFSPSASLFTRRRAQSAAQPSPPWTLMHVLHRRPESHEMLPVRTIRVFQGIKPATEYKLPPVPITKPSDTSVQ